MSYSDLSLWFSWKGRINRRPYFFAGLAAACFTEARKLVPSAFQLAYLPVVLLAFYVLIVIGIKRCHDRGRPGWFMLLNFVPLLNLWPFIELTFVKGTDGDNDYGSDPLAAHGSNAVQ